ncbi:MAG: exodeoxyribonuclease VII small subunit [Candidatus Saccharimonadales bacterium]
MNQKHNTTIEEDIATLEAMVAWFESDAFVLEDALEQYQKAETLASSISERLVTLKNTVIEATEQP